MAEEYEIPIEVTKDNRFGDGKILKHPSFGMIKISRVQSSKGENLFGSSIKHQNVIELTISEGEQERTLNRDWYFGRNPIVKVTMSNTQWADLLMNMNTEGIPCTLTWTKEHGYIKSPSLEGKGEQHLKEFQAAKKEDVEEFNSLVSIVEELFTSGKTLKKADKEEILSKLHHIQMGMDRNADYQVKSFQEQIEKTTSEAKGEIEAFWQNKITQMGLEKLSGENRKSIVELSEEDTE